MSSKYDTIIVKSATKIVKTTYKKIPCFLPVYFFLQKCNTIFDKNEAVQTTNIYCDIIIKYRN